MSSIWLFVSVGGPILLASALAYAIVRKWRDDEMRRDERNREDERRDRNETFI